ncbi:MAG: hypothetical protein AMXMBFR84_11210 [Candidatus Hydrogenedentota bacterium]
MKRFVFFGLALFLALPLTADAQEAAPTLEAGAAKRSIVPPFPTRMGGFFDRVTDFEGVSSPIHARALVCRSGGETVAVVTTDLVAVSKDLVIASREAIHGELGIPTENILISATHSHSGPSGIERQLEYRGEFNEKLFTFLRDQIAEAVKEAHAGLTPAHVGFAYGELDGITRNRQQNNDLVDPQLGVLRLTETDGYTTIATLINFTGHPVILGGGNLLLSSEYPGKASDTVEAVLGGIALYTQGACGDVTMHRQGDPFKEVERLGTLVAGCVVETSMRIRPKADSRVLSQFEEVTVGLREVPPVPEAEARLEAAKAAAEKAKADGADERTVAKLLRAADAAETTAMVAGWIEKNPDGMRDAANASAHVIQIGPMVSVGIPGELFVEYGLEMKRRIRETLDRPMILVGYANGYIGYIVTPRAVFTGGYEQAVARVDQHAGRLLTEAAMEAAANLVR